MVNDSPAVSQSVGGSVGSSPRVFSPKFCGQNSSSLLISYVVLGHILASFLSCQNRATWGVAVGRPGHTIHAPAHHWL